MAKATKIKLTCLIKDKDGKKKVETFDMPIEQAKNLFKDSKRDKSWKIADDKFTMKDGNIISK